MMYEYMTLDDNTTVAHSDMKQDGSVKVYMEKPLLGGFAHVTCYLPEYKWEDNEGFSEAELAFLKKYMENNAHLILELSQNGGFDSASGF